MKCPSEAWKNTWNFYSNSSVPSSLPKYPLFPVLCNILIIDMVFAILYSGPWHRNFALEIQNLEGNEELQRTELSVPISPCVSPVSSVSPWSSGVFFCYNATKCQSRTPVGCRSRTSAMSPWLPIPISQSPGKLQRCSIFCLVILITPL